LAADVTDMPLPQVAAIEAEEPATVIVQTSSDDGPSTKSLPGDDGMAVAVDVQTTPEVQTSPDDGSSTQPLPGKEGMAAAVDVQTTLGAHTSSDDGPSTQSLPGDDGMAVAVDVQTSLGNEGTTSPSFRELIPIPKVTRKVITRTPEKTALQQVWEKKAKKRQKEEEKITKAKKRQREEAKITKPPKAKRLFPKPKPDDTTSTNKKCHRKQPMTGDTSTQPDEYVDDTPCMFCEIKYFESNVLWFKCRQCERWACGQCARMGRKKMFTCDNCK